MIWGDCRQKDTENKDAGKTVLTVKTATIDKTTYGVSAYGASTVNICEGAVIKSETTAENDPNYAVGGNGTWQGTECYGGTVINVSGGTIDGGAYNAGIYQPQNGTLNITGGTISGCAGVDVKAGTATISDGSISTNTTYYTSETNQISVKDGANAVNCAVAIVEKSNYDTAGATVTISGGTFSGAVKMLQASKNSSENYKLSITGGTFNPVPATSDYSEESPYSATGDVNSGATSNFTVTKKSLGN